MKAEENMKKAVLARISPDDILLIFSGLKTVDVHLSIPDIKVPFTVYMYAPSKDPDCPGNVFGEFKCIDIDIFDCSGPGVIFRRFSALHQSRMSLKQMKELANGGIVYGWQIASVWVYDKPVPITQFYEPCDKNCGECDYSCYDQHDEMPGGIGESYCGMGDVESNLQPPEDWCYVEPLW